jgi:hypothetical protein
MPTPFDSLTLTQLQQRLQLVSPTWIADNAALYQGDHWRDGRGWIGPRPAPTDPPDALREVERAFVSQNAIAETIDRHVGGVIGHEPQWSLAVRRALAEDEAPTEAETALIAEAEAALTEWWDTRGAHELLQTVCTRLLSAGRAPLRLYVPDGERDDQGQIPPGALDESLARLFLEALAPTQATILTDTRTMRPGGVYVYQVEADTATGIVAVTVAEITAVDRATGRTELRVIRSDQATQAPPYTFALGGRLLQYELTRRPLISPQVRQQQYLLNLALTMLGRNVVQGGFLERLLLNAQLPGTFQDDGKGGKKFVPDPAFLIGPGRTGVLQGTPIRDEQGRVTNYATPSVVYRNPVPVTTFTDSVDAALAGIYAETHQRHAQISADATTSGESRRQALADFISDLGRTAPQVNRAGRWLLETALAFASVLMGQPGRYDSLRAVFACRIDPGPISADELRLVMELVGARLLSRETGMSRANVEDVDAEQARITAETAALVPLATQAEQGSAADTPQGGTL